jgi:hypothetical protein
MSTPQTHIDRTYTALLHSLDADVSVQIGHVERLLSLEAYEEALGWFPDELQRLRAFSDGTPMDLAGEHADRLASIFNATQSREAARLHIAFFTLWYPDGWEPWFDRLSMGIKLAPYRYGSEIEFTIRPRATLFPLKGCMCRRGECPYCEGQCPSGFCQGEEPSECTVGNRDGWCRGGYCEHCMGDNICPRCYDKREK